MAEENNNIELQIEQVRYDDENIRHLSDMEHVRTRPGMYIGRLGDGSLPEDGIYVLLKEVIDNSIDEFKMYAGDLIEVNIDENLPVRRFCSLQEDGENTDEAGVPAACEEEVPRLRR